MIWDFLKVFESYFSFFLTYAKFTNVQDIFQKSLMEKSWNKTIFEIGKLFEFWINVHKFQKTFHSFRKSS